MNVFEQSKQHSTILYNIYSSIYLLVSFVSYSSVSLAHFSKPLAMKYRKKTQIILIFNMNNSLIIPIGTCNN